ncbi:MAG TPA: DNA polymerase subunit beta, partial [Candidatus Methanoperedens sp.]
MTRKRTRLRDFIITDENWIFAVADYCHEEGVRSVLRYVPDPAGPRGFHKKFRKLDFDDAFSFMRSARPQWVGDVHIVPWDSVRVILSPERRLPLLVRDNRKVKDIVNT